MPAIPYLFWLAPHKVADLVLFLHINATSTSSQKSAKIVHILIEHFPDGNCSAPGFPNTTNNVFAPTYRIGTSSSVHAQRRYTTPAQA